MLKQNDFFLLMFKISWNYLYVPFGFTQHLSLGSLSVFPSLLMHFLQSCYYTLNGNFLCFDIDWNFISNKNVFHKHKQNTGHVSLLLLVFLTATYLLWSQFDENSSVFCVFKIMPSVHTICYLYLMVAIFL